MELIIGIIGTLLALLLGRSFLKGRRPAGAGQGDLASAREAERLAEAARTEAARASAERAEADHAAATDVLNRPHTDDAVADLESRLGGRAAVRPTPFLGSHRGGA